MTGAELDRLAMRARPDGEPVMHQNWENLLFLHWPVSRDAIRPLIPAPLEIDTFEGQAWIGITPFAMSGVRFSALPAIPGLDAFLELNIRTYVHYKGMPGIWFFSLDASRLIPAMAARVLFDLPYFKAEMEFHDKGGEFRFSSARSTEPSARFNGRWTAGERLREPHLESLAFFLVERYCLFAGDRTSLSMTRIYHHPWILDDVAEVSCESSMVRALGIEEPTSLPLSHFSRFMNVEIWAPRPV